MWYIFFIWGQLIVVNTTKELRTTKSVMYSMPTEVFIQLIIPSSSESGGMSSPLSLGTTLEASFGDDDGDGLGLMLLLRFFISLLIYKALL